VFDQILKITICYGSSYHDYMYKMMYNEVVFLCSNRQAHVQNVNPMTDHDRIGRFYRPIFSVNLEPSSTAEFIADKTGQ